MSGVDLRPLSLRERVVLNVERFLDKHLAPLGIFVMRRTRGGIARTWNVDALLLTTHGRRSGRERTVVLRYFPDGDAMIVSANGDGARSDPAWYLNLRADPSARVEIGGRTIPVHAEELPAAEAGTWWQRIVAEEPNYDRFSRAAKRDFPVIRLVPSKAAA